MEEAVFRYGGELAWEDPEVARVGPGDSPWVGRLVPLMHQPGRWANMGVFCDSTGALLKRGTLRTPPGHWEFTCRRRELPKGRAYLFARYLGPSVPDDAVNSSAVARD